MGIILKNEAGPGGQNKLVVQTSELGGKLRLFPGTNQVVLTSIVPGVGGAASSYESTDSGDSFELKPGFPRPILSSTDNIGVSFNNTYYYIGDPSTIDGSSYMAISRNGGQSFEYKAPASVNARRYVSVSVSRDGKYVLAANGAYNSNGNVALTQDFGQTWDTNLFTVDEHFRTFVSPDGQNMVAGSFNSGQTKYSDDFGDTWSTFSETLSSLGGVLISGDGTIKVIYEQFRSGTTGARCYVSTDWSNWTETQLTVRLSRGSISNDGKYILIPASDGYNSEEPYISLSSDYGQTFDRITLSGTSQYSGCAMSSDGKYMIAIPGFEDAGSVYKSVDFGNTWMAITDITTTKFQNVSMSKNGRYVYLSGMGSGGGGLWYSKDYMNTWNLTFDSSTCSGVFINF